MRVFVTLLLAASFCAAQIPEYRIFLSKDDLHILTHRDPFSDDYLPARFEYDGRVWEDVKIRYKGRSTRFFPEKSYRIKFPVKEPFRNARHLNLHAMYLDQSLMHEKLSYDLFSEMGELAPQASYIHLSINGKSQGIYLAVDRVDEHFLANRGRVVGPLYSAGSFFALADMTVQDTSLLKQYYPKEIGDPDDFDDLHRLLMEINGVPDSAFADIVNREFDMESVYGWLAGNILTMMGDSYTKNYYLYRDTTRQTRQWTIIPWDYDIAFGQTGDLAIEYPKSLLNPGFSYTFPPLSGPDNVLKDRIWKTPSLQEHLRRRVDTLLQTVFTDEHMSRRIDSIATVIQSSVKGDTLRRGTLGDFLDHVDALKYFVMARRQYLLEAFVHQPSGMLDSATVPTVAAGVPYYFVGFDGRLIATLWCNDNSPLDSVQVVSHPGLLPPEFDSLNPGPYVRRWISITPFPEDATFSARFQWMYHDLSSKDREVPPNVPDERALRCFLCEGKSRVQIQARINTVANTVTIERLTQKECGPSKYFVLGVPENDR